MAALFGLKLQCPICRIYSKNMKPYGLYNRVNSQCRSCGSLERYRWLYLWLALNSDIFDKKVNVLEIAPNPSLYYLFSGRKNIFYISTDICENDVPVDIIADMTFFPAKNNSFDYIILMQVLEHVDNDMAVVAECKRLLKEKGKCIITAPIDMNRLNTITDLTLASDQRREYFGQNDHVRIYGNDLLDKLREFDFSSVTRVAPGMILSEKEMKTFSIKKSYQFHDYTTCDDLFICEK